MAKTNDDDIASLKTEIASLRNLCRTLIDSGKIHNDIFEEHQKRIEYLESKVDPRLALIDRDLKRIDAITKSKGGGKNS